ncbi:MAG: hypothetical protein AAF549_05510 [Pseudomonadota bacterium]
MTIKLLDIVFSKPASPEDLARQIESLNAEYDQCASLVEDNAKGRLATRVLQVARAAAPDVDRRYLFEKGAEMAGADQDCDLDSRAEVYVRGLGVRIGTIDTMNFSHDLNNLSDGPD